MSDIFLSYRRDDEPGYVGRLADGITAAFGEIVFRDVDSIRAGSKWKIELRKQVSQAQVLIAVIGQRWQSILSERDPERDYVRHELNLAHQLEIPVIPVKMQDAPFDYKQDLGDLSWLRELQCLELSDRQGRWGTDLDQLVGCILDSTALERIYQSDQPAPGIQPASISQQTSVGNQSPNIQSDGGNVTISFNGGDDKN